MITTPRVARWLQSLPDDEATVIIDTVSQVTSDLDTPSPRCRRLASNLWEARITFAHRRQARVMFGFRNGEPVMLSGLMKKDQSRHQLAIVRAQQDMRSA